MLSWLQKQPWLSLALVFFSYAVFGRLYTLWSLALIEQNRNFGLSLDQGLVLALIEVLGGFIVVLMAMVFTAPIALIAIGFRGFAKSEQRVLVLLLIFCLFCLIAVHWLESFAHFLTLLCAAIFGRLAIQTAGYNKWQTLTILTLICLIGFSSGVISAVFWHSQFI